MPFTKGDVKQLLIGLVFALGSALLWNLDALLDTSLREVDWVETGWQLADNLFQAAVVYFTAWFGITKSGIVRTQQVVPAGEVRPTTEPVIEQIAEPEKGT